MELKPKGGCASAVVGSWDQNHIYLGSGLICDKFFCAKVYIYIHTQTRTTFLQQILVFKIQVFYLNLTIKLLLCRLVTISNNLQVGFAVKVL